MKLFTGRWTHSLDSKNRCSVPKKLLSALREDGELRSVYLTKGLDGCLSLFTDEEFDRIAVTLEASPQGDPDSRAFVRTFFSSAQPCGVDKAGRLLIPDELKALAGIEDKVLFAGIGRRIELWHPDLWARRQAAADDNYDDNAQAVLR